MYNPFSLLGKRILVTGASSGIGRATAIEWSKMGANVILTARNEERLNETLQQMDNIQLHQIIVADLSNMDDIKTLVDSIGNPLDGIVLCAGFTIVKPFRFVSENNIDSIINVNFKASAILLQMLLKRKGINKKASIVFISSVSGVWVSTMGNTLYSASKGAVNGLIKGLALEMATKAIRVNSVNPGMVNTPFFKDDVISKEELQEDIKRYPLGRYGNPKEIAYAVIYLLSDASAWVTGTNLLIDGGYTLL